MRCTQVLLMLVHRLVASWRVPRPQRATPNRLVASRQGPRMQSGLPLGCHWLRLLTPSRPPWVRPGDSWNPRLLHVVLKETKPHYFGTAILFLRTFDPPVAPDDCGRGGGVLPAVCGDRTARCQLYHAGRSARSGGGLSLLPARQDVAQMRHARSGWRYTPRNRKRQLCAEVQLYNGCSPVATAAPAPAVWLRGSRNRNADRVAAVLRVEAARMWPPRSTLMAALRGAYSPARSSTHSTHD
jgi:hypothetical protein